MGVKVRQKGDKWFVFVNHRGQRKAKSVGSKQAAEQVKRKLEAKLALEGLSALDESPPVPTFANYTVLWVNSYLTVACKQSSQRAVQSIINNHLLPHFGKMTITSITRTHVRQFLVSKVQTLSSNYTRAIHRTLHGILQNAVDDELITKNPASRMGKILVDRSGGGKESIDPFTSAEVAQYLLTVQTHCPEHYAYFLLLCRSGIRQGEALGLRWEDVQFGADETDPYRFIHVQRTYDYVHRVMNTPKNGKTRRVDMSKELRSVLRDLYESRLDEAIIQGRTEVDPLVFPGHDGLPMSPSGMYRLHQRICRAAGLRAVRIHDLRHSYATIHLYELHSPIQYVSEQLGHSNIQITVNTYGHPRQGTNIGLADKLDFDRENTLPYATIAQPLSEKICT